MKVEEIHGLVRAHEEAQIRGPRRQMFVSRKNLWRTTSPYFQRRSFVQGSGYLHIHFTAEDGGEEEGVDLGGPRREFFRLLVHAIAHDSGLLAGL